MFDPLSVGLDPIFCFSLFFLSFLKAPGGGGGETKRGQFYETLWRRQWQWQQKQKGKVVPKKKNKRNAISPCSNATGTKFIDATIRIGQEIGCLPYAGFFKCIFSSSQHISRKNKAKKKNNKQKKKKKKLLILIKVDKGKGWGSAKVDRQIPSRYRAMIYSYPIIRS